MSAKTIVEKGLVIFYIWLSITTLIYIASIFLDKELITKYEQKELIHLPSPTGEWTPLLVESVVDGPVSLNVTTSLQLTSKFRPDDFIDILGVDTSGHDEERPLLAWSATNVLRVTLQNDDVKVLTRQADGVEVDVQIDPADPAFLAAKLAQWKRLGVRPD